ncbi:hypothetical protein ACFLXQ_01110 [Chloroflexota bacterium]
MLSTLSWLDVTALSISAVMGISLVLIVLGSNPKYVLNISFPLFVLPLTALASIDILKHQSLLTDNPLLPVDPTLLIQTAMRALFLLFIILYLDHRTRWINLAVGVDLAVVAVSCSPLFNHQLIFNPYSDLQTGLIPMLHSLYTKSSLDVTGVTLVDSGVANHMNKTIQTARHKGAYTIITGISNAVAETNIIPFFHSAPPIFRSKYLC